MSTRRKRAIIALIAIAILFVLSRLFTGGAEEVATSTLPPVVQTITAGEFTGNTTVSLIGTVRAFSEAAVTAEQTGRVTSVPVQLGQQVQAGQVLVTLENASQRASVLQAEGVYEAALAAAAQTAFGTNEAESRVAAAEDSVASALSSAYTTVNGVVRNNIDQFYANPDSALLGLRLSGTGNSATLNALRVDFQTILPNWQQQVAAGSYTNPSAAITEASQYIDKTIQFVDTFLLEFNNRDNTGRYSAAELAQFSNTFTGIRANLVQTQAGLDAALTNLQTSQDALERARIAGSGTDTSAADAQVKQALGTLRAAQANLAKTIIRTPIAGTVNTLSVRTGDFVGMQQQVAEVANNNALEVVTAVGEKERTLLSVGDEVLLEGDIVGTVTEVAPAIDPSTGKIQVRIAAASSDLQNGDTVTITKEAATATDTRVFVPLSAVKFEQTDGAVFLVKDGTLEARPVTIGVVRGGSVEIIDGLNNNESIVRDARGLQAGDVVEVQN